MCPFDGGRTAIMKNKPVIYKEVILPGFISGVMWAVAQSV